MATDIVTVTAPMAKNTRADILAYVAVGALIACVVLLFFKGDALASGARDALLLIIGSQVAIVKDVYAFEFNSTRANKDKDATIAAMQKEK